MKTTVLRLGVLSVALSLAACANNPYPRTTVGAGVGAVAGGVLGHQLDDDKGRYAGAAVGALVGGAIGNYMDRQQQDFNQALASERQRGLEIQRQQDGSIRLEIPAEISFDVDRAEVKPAFYSSLDKVAGILREYPQTTVDIIGHTDNTGSEAYNLDLSHRRAQSVAGYLSTRGVDYGRLRTDGRGESQPRADNSTASGRALNRRVEMIVRPVTTAESGYNNPQYPQGGDPYNPQGLPQGGYNQPQPYPYNQGYSQPAGSGSTF